MVYPDLYTLDSRGKVRIFKLSIEKSEDNNGEIPMILSSTGIIDGKLVKKITYVNRGYQNRSLEEQARLQADALYLDKQNEGYKSISKLCERESIGNIGGEGAILNYFKKHPEAYQTNKDWNYLPMLAIKYKDAKKVEFPCIVQPKLNGVRCLASIKKGKVQLVSRGGTYYHIPHIICQLDSLFTDISHLGNFMFDGELYKHGANLQDISGAARTQEGEMLIGSNEWLEYHIYDIVNLYDITLNNGDRDKTKSFIDSTGLFCKASIKYVKSYIALDKTEIQELHDTFLEEGYEGAMIRNPSAPYKFNQRSKDLIKVKTYQDEEFEIVDCEAKDEGNIGESFVFILKNNIDEQTFKARPMGSIEQKEIWYNHIESYIGNKVTVRFQERSKDKLPVQGHVRSELCEVLHLRPSDE